jgi:hypothetical protein
VRYSIEDNFLTFWFRFKYSHIIEIGGFKIIEKLMEKSVLFRKATGELDDYNFEFKGYSISDM